MGEGEEKNETMWMGEGEEKNDKVRKVVNKESLKEQRSGRRGNEREAIRGDQSGDQR